MADETLGSAPEAQRRPEGSARTFPASVARDASILESYAPFILVKKTAQEKENHGGDSC
jgi:hypothetical protein